MSKLSTARRLKAVPNPDQSLTLDELDDLKLSWRLQLRSEDKAKGTVEIYVRNVDGFIAWAREHAETDRFTKAVVQTYVVESLAEGLSQATVVSRLAALRSFARWLFESGETPELITALIKQPRIDQKLVPGISDEQLKALVAACKGKGFLDKRDEALVRFLAETGARAEECVSIKLSDVNLAEGRVTIMGKGRKERRVPFGDDTAVAIDRYIRIRKTHRLANSDRLWLGHPVYGRGTMGYQSMWHCLAKRAEKAGIADFHPHKLRHTFATRWLDAEGSETGLMKIAGWSSHRMVEVYTGTTAERRALREARALNLGKI